LTTRARRWAPPRAAVTRCSAATARGAASIKGLQGRVAAVMKAERKEGNIVRQAMVRKEQDEVRLDGADRGETGQTVAW